MNKSDIQNAKEQLTQIAKLEDNWNEKGAKKFSKELIKRCEEILIQLSGTPEIFPTACNSIQMEYEKENGEYLEFEIYENKIELFRIYEDGGQSEGVMGGAIEYVVEKMNEHVLDFYKNTK